MRCVVYKPFAEVVTIYNSFDECLRALLNDNGLEEARGGQMTKQGEQFNYRLFNQPEIEGDLFFDLYSSTDPNIDWVRWPVTDEADAALNAFMSDPRNGQLFEV
jgi:hypothetical protein